VGEHRRRRRQCRLDQYQMLDETGDIEKSQGWTAIVLDTNGNGVRDEYTEPGKPQEPGKDMLSARRSMP